MASSTINKIYKTDSSDTIKGLFTSSDHVYGLGGNDTFDVTGTGTLYGGKGSDIFKIAGDFTIVDYSQGEALDVSEGATASLSVDKSRLLDLSGDNVKKNEGTIKVTGTAGSDTITGSIGVDSIAAGGGNDSLSGGDGNDKLDGGAGNDKLFGDADDDTLDGGAGNDTLTGGDGNDDFIVGSGTDTIMDFGQGSDVDNLVVAKGATANVYVHNLDSTVAGAGAIIQNAGKVNLYLDNAAAVDLSEATGFKNSDGDVVGVGMGYTITAAGNSSGSEITGSDFSDTIIGGDGNDKIDGGSDGKDVLTGGKGDDTFTVSVGVGTVTDFGIGNDDLIVGDGVDGHHATANVTVVADYIASSATINNKGEAILTLTKNATNVSLLEADSDTSGFTVYASGLASTITGSAGDDTLVGGAGKDRLDGAAGDDSLSGGSGNDTLYGGDGNDILNGGAGADTLIGGDGNDSYIVDNKDDRVVEGTGVGTGDDTVYSSINFTLTVAGDVENLTLIGTGYDIDKEKYGKSDTNGTGNSLGNTLTGNDGNNLLDGAAGNDVLIGGKGADNLKGGDDDDIFSFSAGDSGQATKFDKILDFKLDSDIIRYTNHLNSEGMAATATSTQASINATTGIATFADKSGTSMTDALNDIAARFSAAGDDQGDFALFQLSNRGDYYLFVSDGVKGVTSGDLVVQLVGVTSIDHITVTDTDLTINAPATP